MDRPARPRLYDCQRDADMDAAQAEAEASLRRVATPSDVRASIFVLDLNTMEATAWQRRHRIFISRGAVSALSKDELDWLVGHELSHLRDRPLDLGTAIAVKLSLLIPVALACATLMPALVGAGTALAYGMSKGIVQSRLRRSSAIRAQAAADALAVMSAPSRIVLAATDRRRELRADAVGVQVKGSATTYGISALYKFEAYWDENAHASVAGRPISTRLRIWLDEHLARTHPSAEKRRNALRGLAQ